MITMYTMMIDEITGSLEYTLFILGCPGSFNCRHSSLCWIQLYVCCSNENTQIIWLRKLGINSPSPASISVFPHGLQGLSRISSNDGDQSCWRCPRSKHPWQNSPTCPHLCHSACWLQSARNIRDVDIKSLDNYTDDAAAAHRTLCECIGVAVNAPVIALWLQYSLCRLARCNATQESMKAPVLFAFRA